MSFYEFFGLIVCSSSADDPRSQLDPHTFCDLIYLKALENELIPGVETLFLNLDMPTSQHFTFLRNS